MLFLKRLLYVIGFFLFFVVAFIILSYKGLGLEGDVRGSSFNVKTVVKSQLRREYATTAPLPPTLASLTTNSSTASTESRFNPTQIPLLRDSSNPTFKDTRASAPVSPSTSDSNVSSNEEVMSLIQSLFNLGLKNPSLLVSKLQSSDIFMSKQGVDNFTCPPIASTIDFPNFIYNKKNAQDFKDKKKGSFLFYQHLRKAGGTSFCDFARSNIPRKFTPGYYCMPDDKGSLATPPWNDFNYLGDDIKKHEYRIVANEWDAFYSRFTSYPGAVFGTTIRDAIDRWYSQYRFEYLEHRDGTPADSPRPVPFIKWYNNNKNWMMGPNYYVKTFIGNEDRKPLPKNPQGDFYWTYHKYNEPKYELNWSDMKKAIENIRKFHLILVLDWLNEKTTHGYIKKELGWDIPPKQVLPHESQAERKDKHSKKASEELSPEDLLFVQKENVFDMLFFEITKRIVLERIHCS